MILNLINFLIGRASFYPFESYILDKVKDQLDFESSSRLQHQIEVINKIQRLYDGKEVNLYQMHHGKAIFDDNLRFTNTADEALLASINLLSLNKRAKLKVEVWLATRMADQRANHQFVCPFA